ncbi:hypothetical protein [Burkholderia pseudomallei]|uniref:hypothetical protein n=1 Tax=Burkholderia pseudomallei TaxID=28450 RepID=UPI0011CDEE2D|nr:hypothetical protein [Burkholderia pseudomallei]
MAGAKPWAQIESAFALNLGEFLPWMWTAIDVKLFAAGDYVATAPTLLQPAASSLGQSSLDAARRGYLLALFKGSGDLSSPPSFEMAGMDPSGTHFSFLAYSVQATRWPSPVPQEALRNVLILELPRAALASIAPKERVAAILAFAVPGRSYALPQKTAIRDFAWTASSAPDVVEFASAGLMCGEVLSPPQNLESFLHPADSLWLRSELGNSADFDDEEFVPGEAIGDHDWWTRLHDGVANTADVPRMMVEALRLAPESAELHRDFSKSLIALCGCLRDRMEPGIVCDRAPRMGREPVAMYPFPRTPVMLDLLAALRTSDPDATGPLDLLAMVLRSGESGWSVLTDTSAALSPADLGRVSLVYCVLYRELFNAPSAGDWYSTLREILPKARALPEKSTDLQSALELLSAEERLALAEALCVDAVRPAVRAEALLRGWEQAVHLATSDPPLLAQAKVQAQGFVRGLRDSGVLASFLEKQDTGALFAATAALGTIRAATRADPPGTKKPRFATKIAAAAVDHARARMSPSPVFRPALAVDPLTQFLELESAAAAMAEEAHGWIFRRSSVDATGEPGPLVLEIDTLNDDSDLHANDTDLNQWLNGYCAFFRRSEPPQGRSEWGSGQIGVIEARMWSPAITLTDTNGHPLPALHPEPASTSYGVRQVLLHHNNRSQLPASSMDMIDNSASAQVENGWAGAESFVVVAGVASPTAKLPFLAFGIEYESAVFAQARCGVIPAPLAGANASATPYRFDLFVDLTNAIPATSLRTLKYLRRTTVSAPRVKPRPDIADPRWSPLSVSRELNLAHAAFPSQQDESSAVVCVLMSGAGLPAGERVDPAWMRMRFELMPPACTQPLYDRWIAYEHATAPPADKARWAKWRERIHASEMLVAAWKGQDTRNDVALQQRIDQWLQDRRAQLDDPAVTAFVFRWVPLRSDVSSEPPYVLKLTRRPGPLTPTPADPNDDTTILFDRGNAGPDDWTFQVQVYDGARTGLDRFAADSANRILTILLWPGEIGDLVVSSALHTGDLARCDLNATETIGDWAIFSAWHARFEVATPNRLSPADLYAHCRAILNDQRDIALTWNRESTTAGQAIAQEVLQLDNVGRIRARRQVWHATGRPLPVFPSASPDFDDMTAIEQGPDGSPDPTASGVLWDAIGFAERFDSSATWTGYANIGIQAGRQTIAEELAGSETSPRYLRYQIEAEHRYASLYLPMMVTDEARKMFNPYFAQIANGTELQTAWRRAFRPGADLENVPRPAVRLVVPLTRSLQGSTNATGADLLVVLNEEIGTTHPLVTQLEAEVEVVHREWVNQSVSKLEHGPDPILSGKAQSGKFVGLSCVGPLGHTFDTDTREPYFVGTSYLVRSAGILEAWEFAKLSFRRVLLPEMMEGFYRVPAANEAIGERIVTLTSKGPLEVTGVQLQDSAQAQLSYMGVPAGPTGVVFTIEFFGASMSLMLKRTTKAMDGANEHEWALSSSAQGGAFVDTDWTVKFSVQADDPGPRLCSADVRIIVAKIREGTPDTNPLVPALWEVAGYVAVSSRAANRSGSPDFAEPWDRQWRRILTWQMDEPMDLAGSRVRLQSSEMAAHARAQAVRRVSDYTPAEWVQTLPDSGSLSVAGKPWVARTPGKELQLRVVDAAAHAIGIFEGETDAKLNWQKEPVAATEDGQGLFHRLLVTQQVQTADGSASEAYFGLFNQAAGNRFERIEPATPIVQLPEIQSLRAYVLLMQRSGRTYTTPPIGFWDSLFPGKRTGSQQTEDARLRILAVGEAISGGA